MEILAIVPVYSDPPFLYFILFVVASFIAFSGFVFGIFYAINEKSWIACLVGFSLIIIGLFGASHTTNAMERTSVLNYNTYKVTIDETVNAREFLNQYEILSREGEIFTIKEIEVDE